MSVHCRIWVIVVWSVTVEGVELVVCSIWLWLVVAARKRRVRLVGSV
jgi:hypothetical protein